MKIELKNISKTIKSNIILKNIDICLESGKIYGFVGTNGSGKTMLMRILTGLVKYDQGELYIDDVMIKKNHKDLYYNMGVIIEKPDFFNEQTGLENLVTLASIRNVISKEKIVESMNLVGLDPNNRKKVKEYSLGMRQRLGVAQAIMENPDVLILDEVTNGLDSDGIQRVYNILKSEKEKGKIIVISSHHKTDINELCDFIYFFENQTIKEI